MITSRILLKDVCINLSRFFSLSRIFVEFCLTFIFQRLGKMFKFMIFRLLENAFASLEVTSRHFYSYSPRKTFHRFLFSLLGRGKLLIRHGRIFQKSVSPSLSSPSCRGLLLTSPLGKNLLKTTSPLT